MEKLEAELDKFMASLGYGINAVERVDLKRIVLGYVEREVANAGEQFELGADAGHHNGVYDGVEDARHQAVKLAKEFLEELEDIRAS